LPKNSASSSLDGFGGWGWEPLSDFSTGLMVEKSVIYSIIAFDEGVCKAMKMPFRLA